MDLFLLLGVFITGFLLGISAALLLRLIHSKTARQLAEQIRQEEEALRRETIDTVLADMKANFGNLSLEALARSSEEFLKLAKSKLDSERELGQKDLDSKKLMIDEQVKRMAVELEKVTGLVKELEKDRVEKFGEISGQLQSTREQTAALTETTNNLNRALASTTVRGQWGERMAEDVLRLVGFIENVNYLKQKSIEGSGTRPDFTFLLPKGLRLNMDVKFPLDNYMKYQTADTEAEMAEYRNHFLRDVKARIKEVTTRDYINPEQNTLDYVLLFIPNEQVYAFIHDQDHSILDDGIKSKVVLCSPLTLVAVLGVIRRAVDNFALEKTSNRILSLLNTFHKQWDAFIKKFETLGKRIGDTQREYETLTTTRRRQLEKPLKEIEELRSRREVSGPAQVERAALRETGTEGE